MSEKIIIAFGTQILLLVVWFVKQTYETKKQKKEQEAQREQDKKELSAQDKLVANRLKVIENNVFNIKDMIKEVKTGLGTLKDDNDFRNKLRNAIRIKSSTIINANFGTNDKFKNILLSWEKEIEDFALIWFYSELRGKKDKDKMYKFLKPYIDNRIHVLSHIINNSVKEVRVLPSTDKKGILFSEFLDQYKVYNQIEVLIMVLSKNGMTKHDVLETFECFIDDFYRAILVAVTLWITLEQKTDGL